MKRSSLLLMAALVTLAAISCDDPAAPERDPDALLEIPVPQAEQLSEGQRSDYEQEVAALAAAPSADRFGELGRRLLADGFAAASEPAFANAVKLDPERFDWHYYLAHVLLGSGRHADAATAFERAIQLQPESVAAQVWLGNAHFQAANYELANQAYANAIELQPGAASAHLGLGRSALAEQRFDDAVESLTRALELSPEATIAHYPLAQAYRSLGEMDLAQQHLDQRGDREAYPIDPLMEEIRTDFGSAGGMTDRGGSAYSKGEFERAAAAFRRAVAMEPEAALAHSNLGAALMASGDLEQAKRSYGRALELDPNDAATLFSLGVIAAVEGRPEAAIQRFVDATEVDPQYLPAQLELGHRYAAARQFARAAEQYRRVLELEPRRAVAQWGLAMVTVQTGRWAEAVRHLEQASATLPDQPAFAHALARILASAPEASVRDGKRALQILDGLMRAGMNNTDVGESVAMALAQQGDFEQAERIQSQAMAAAQAAGDAATVERMQLKLQSYQAGQPWSRPWESDDPIFDVPQEALPAPPRRGSFNS